MKFRESYSATLSLIVSSMLALALVSHSNLQIDENLHEFSWYMDSY